MKQAMLIEATKKADALLGTIAVAGASVFAMAEARKMLAVVIRGLSEEVEVRDEATDGLDEQ